MMNTYTVFISMNSQLQKMKFCLQNINFHIYSGVCIAVYVLAKILSNDTVFAT